MVSPRATNEAVWPRVRDAEMSSDGEDRRPAASRRRHRRGKQARRDHRSPSYSPSHPYRSGAHRDEEGRDRRSRGRSPASRRLVGRSNGNRDEEEGDRRSRSRSRSRSPNRRGRVRSNGYREVRDEEERGDRRSGSGSRSRSRSRSRSPNRRGRDRSNSYSDEEEGDRRSGSGSRSPRGRRAPRNNRRSRSRTPSEERDDRLEERDDRRRGFRPRPAGDHRDEDDQYTSADEEDDFYVRIDRPIFQCSHCEHLLSSPVYECVEGHVTCADCHAYSNGEHEQDDGVHVHQCSVCGSADYFRSRAVESWLRSIRFSCKNYDYGCPAFLPWHRMDAHESACRHAPVFCPVRRCDFYGGPPDTLERHLAARHGWAVAGVRYGQPFRASADPAVRSVLRAEGDGALFHLRASWERGGRALSMVRIRPDDAAGAADEYTYEVRTLAAAGMQHQLQIQSTVWGTSLRHGTADGSPVSVTVPEFMFSAEGPEADSVEVCIRKVAPAAGARDNQ